MLTVSIAALLALVVLIIDTERGFSREDKGAARPEEGTAHGGPRQSEYTEKPPPPGAFPFWKYPLAGAPGWTYENGGESPGCSH